MIREGGKRFHYHSFMDKASLPVSMNIDEVITFALYQFYLAQNTGADS